MITSLVNQKGHYELSTKIPIIFKLTNFTMFCAFLLTVLWAPKAAAAQLTLSWQPSTDSDVSGYRLFFRQEDKGYDYPEFRKYA